MRYNIHLTLQLNTIKTAWVNISTPISLNTAQKWVMTKLDD